jgi:tRNA uridine 5-carboxymethylaminomethyl modification enzyme
LHTTWIRIDHNNQLNHLLEKPLQQDCRADDFLKRPEINYQHLQTMTELALPQLPQDVAEQIEIQCKYAGYIARQKLEIDRLRKHEEMPLPKDFDYHQIRGLSSEVIQKLNQIQPHSMAQASRISGVTPAALSLLLVHLKKQKQGLVVNDE